MVNKRKRKRRLRKAIAIRKKNKLKRSWRQIFVNAGILSDMYESD
jgi:hypothetical protein